MFNCHDIYIGFVFFFFLTKLSLTRISFGHFIEHLECETIELGDPISFGHFVEHVEYVDEIPALGVYYDKVGVHYYEGVEDGGGK